MKDNWILISRTDRIGDLLLSVPVFKTFKKVYPKTKLAILVSDYAAPILENENYIDKIFTINNKDKHLDDALINEINSLECEKALMLYYDKNILKLLKKAKIKQISGPASNFSSVVMLNTWRKQNRHKVHKHELEYNLELLSLLGINTNKWIKNISITVSDLAKIKIENQLNLKKKKYIIIHPVMGGSALNWRYSFYGELALRLIDEFNIDVFFTGSNSKEDMEIINLLLEQTNNKAYSVAGQFDLKHLAAFISGASLLIAPSTGPIHIAAATGVPVIGIYSDIRVQSPKRWAPYTDLAKIFTPKVQCKEIYKCKGEKCEDYLCMDTIDIAELTNAAKTFLTQKEKPKDLGF